MQVRDRRQYSVSKVSQATAKYFSCIIVREFYSPRGCNKTERGSGDSPCIFNSSRLLRPRLALDGCHGVELSENRSGSLTTLLYMTKA